MAAHTYVLLEFAPSFKEFIKYFKKFNTYILPKNSNCMGNKGFKG